jgi:hypothetical protein
MAALQDFRSRRPNSNRGPFITSDEPMSAPIRSSRCRPLPKDVYADRTGREVTEEDRLADGWKVVKDESGGSEGLNIRSRGSAYRMGASG